MKPYYDQRNPVKAKSLLKQAGYNGEKITLQTNSNYPNFRDAFLLGSCINCRSPVWTPASRREHKPGQRPRPCIAGRRSLGCFRGLAPVDQPGDLLKGSIRCLKDTVDVISLMHR
jgi:hypothetical protein